MCNKCHAIIDNSHSYIRGPKDIVDQFFLDLGFVNEEYPCDDRKSLPSNKKIKSLDNLFFYQINSFLFSFSQRSHNQNRKKRNDFERLPICF